MPSRTAPKSVDDYIARYPPDIQTILQTIRLTVKKAAPRAVERISYGMPAFFLDGVLIYFAAFKKHIGIFPPVRGDAKLDKALAPYRGPKGNLQFPLNQPIRYALIARVVKCRAREQAARTKAKRKRA